MRVTSLYGALVAGCCNFKKIRAFHGYCTPRLIKDNLETTLFYYGRLGSRERIVIRTYTFDD